MYNFILLRYHENVEKIWLDSFHISVLAHREVVPHETDVLSLVGRGRAGNISFSFYVFKELGY